MEHKIAQPSPLIRERMKTPRVAAFAGILFSVLLTTTLVLIRIAAPATFEETLVWPTKSAGALMLALNLVPFAGVAFLWFIGVVRDRLGAYEDRFFATIFFGSGILFLAMLFIAAADGGGDCHRSQRDTQPDDRIRRIHFRPCPHYPYNERLCTQNGSGIHDLMRHPGHPHAHPAARDNAPGLRSGGPADGEQPFCSTCWPWLFHSGCSC